MIPFGIYLFKSFQKSSSFRDLFYFSAKLQFYFGVLLCVLFAVFANLGFVGYNAMGLDAFTFSYPFLLSCGAGPYVQILALLAAFCSGKKATILLVLGITLFFNFLQRKTPLKLGFSFPSYLFPPFWLLQFSRLS